jgi:hypothetical protein
LVRVGVGLARPVAKAREEREPFGAVLTDLELLEEKGALENPRELDPHPRVLLPLEETQELV